MPMSCFPARCCDTDSWLTALHVCLILASSLLLHGWWCSLWPALLSWSQACCGALMQKAWTWACQLWCQNYLRDICIYTKFHLFLTSLCAPRDIHGSCVHLWRNLHQWITSVWRFYSIGMIFEEWIILFACFVWGFRFFTPNWTCRKVSLSCQIMLRLRG